MLLSTDHPNEGVVTAVDNAAMYSVLQDLPSSKSSTSLQYEAVDFHVFKICSVSKFATHLCSSSTEGSRIHVFDKVRG
jgi:hypothetical protein